MPTDLQIGLTQTQIEQLREAKQAIPQIKKEINRAKLAGIDVSHLEKQLAEQEQQVSKLLAAYDV